MPRCINNVTPPAKPKPPTAKQIGFTPRKWDKLDAASGRGPFIYFHFTYLSLISTAMMMVQVSDFKSLIRTKLPPPLCALAPPAVIIGQTPRKGAMSSPSDSPRPRHVRYIWIPESRCCGDLENNCCEVKSQNICAP